MDFDIRVLTAEADQSFAWSGTVSSTGLASPLARLVRAGVAATMKILFPSAAECSRVHLGDTSLRASRGPYWSGTPLADTATSIGL